MIDYEQLSGACKTGAQAQSYTTTKTMWDDVQTLKEDIKKLRDAINHIQEFLNRAYP